MHVEPGAPQGQAPDMAPPPASRSDRPPTGWRLWLLAARPRTLTIALAPVLAGGAWGWVEFHRFDAVAWTLALLAAVLIQAGTNLWNDLGDARRGGDQPLRQGPPRVTALGWASPRQVERTAQLCFGAATLIGLVLAWVGGWPIVALGLASLLAGWAYSAGPRPIAYTAWGELAVVAYIGVGAVAGTVWLTSGAVSARTVLVGVAFGLPAAAVLLVNNVRDLEHDRLVGRRTLAMHLGQDRARLAYAVLLLAPFALLLAPFMPVGGWLALPAAGPALRLVLAFATTPRGSAFNALLAATARCQLLLAMLWSAGIIVLD